MITFKSTRHIFIFLGYMTVLIFSGCLNRDIKGDYDSVHRNAAVVLELELIGMNPEDTKLLEKKYIGQSSTQVMEGLEQTRTRVPRGVVLEWARRTDRIEIRVGTDLVAERMAYALSLLVDQNDIVRGISWHTASFPSDTRGYLGPEGRHQHVGK